MLQLNSSFMIKVLSDSAIDGHREIILYLLLRGCSLGKNNRHTLIHSFLGIVPTLVTVEDQRKQVVLRATIAVMFNLSRVEKKLY